MTDLKFKPGQLVDPKRAMRFGTFAVAANRLFSMSKWMGALIAFGIGNPVIYLVSVGIGVGALVDANTGGQGLNGVSYMQFVAPALLATSAIGAVVDEVSFPVLEGFVWDKMFFAINNTPITSRQIANGIMIAAATRGAATIVVYEVILLLFGAIPLSSVIPMFLSSMLAALAFGAVMMAFACRIEKDDGLFAIVNRFIITPMFLFSGTFYPLEDMPIYLQWIGWVSPLWHSTQLGRVFSFGLPLQSWQVVMHISFLSLLVVIGMAMSYPKFKARLQK